MRNSAATILRWGLAFVFFYAAVASLQNPEPWSRFLFGGFSVPFLLTVFSVYELALAVWLFTGRMLLWSSLLSALTLASIVAANFGEFFITFRDVGLFMAALALFELARSKEAQQEEAGHGTTVEEELL